jgi:phosphomannomutase/phosphoglucomutase
MKEKSSKNAEETGKIGLLRYSIGGIAVSVLAMLLVTYWLVSSVMTGANDKHQRTILDVYTQQVTNSFDLTVEQKRQQVASLAAFTMTIEAMMLPDEASRERAANVLMSRVVDAVNVQLIPVGKGQINNSTVPPINFSTLDIINRTERGEIVPMEVLFNPDKKYLQIARPVFQNDRLIGTLIVFLDPSFLLKTLASLDVKGSNLTLTQQYNEGVSKAVFTVGAKNGNEPITLKTANRLWIVGFQPSDQIAGATVVAASDILQPLIIALIIVILSILMTSILLQRTVTKDAGDFTRYTAKLLMGQTGELPDFKLSLFLSMAKHLARVKIKARTSSGPEVARPFNEPVDHSDVESVSQVLATPKDDFLDIDMIGRDADILGISGNDAQGESVSAVSEAIFRAVDIQGIVGRTLDSSVAKQIGKALGSEAYERGDQTLIVARDGRVSGADLSSAFIDGLLETGRDVIDIGAVPIPVLYFAMQELGVSSGVMVTASHMPANVNGFRIILGGRDLPAKQIKGLYHRINNENFLSGEGRIQKQDVRAKYIKRILKAVDVPRKLKVVVDGGHGIAGGLAVELLTALGCDVEPLHCEVDGRFPAHLPDPSKPDNLRDLIAAVTNKQADLGIAFDGDGDRIGLVTNSGRIIWPDKLLLLFAKDLLTRSKSATIVYDVNCSRRLQGLIIGFGGKPVMCATGRESLVKSLKESGALLAGNQAGNIFFSEKWLGFDDALFAMVALLEILARDTQSVDVLFEHFPDDLSTPEFMVDVDPDKKVSVLDAVVANATFSGGVVTKVDGLRVDFNDGWGLVRLRKTRNQLAFRFEADNQAAMSRIQEAIKGAVMAQDGSLEFPF